MYNDPNLYLPQPQNPNGFNPYPASAVIQNFTRWSNGDVPLLWAVNGTYYEAYMDTPLWDIRAEWVPGEQVAGAGVNLLGTGTMGLNRYLAVLMRGPTKAPADIVGLRAYATQTVGLASSKWLAQLAEVEFTSEVQAGGRQAAATNSPLGGSLIQFTVPGGVRFWKIRLRFSFPVASGDAPLIRLDMASN